MCEKVTEIAGALEALVRELESRSLDVSEATCFVESFARVERLAAAGRTIAVKPVAEADAHLDLGFRSTAEFVASYTRGSLSEAIGVVAAAGALDSLPALRERLISGSISSMQAGLVAQAASADPSAEQALLDAADREPLARLRERCQMVRAAAVGDESSTERIRAGRFLRHWTDARDGACRIEARLAPDDAAGLFATLDKEAERRQLESIRAGHFLSLEACRADALCSLAEPDSGPRAQAVIRVDATALERGHLAPGETCEVEGIGPISVTAAKRVMRDSFVSLIETNGVDVGRMVRLGRSIPASVRTALWERDGGRCVICGSRSRLEIDHIYGYAITRRTTLSELALLCYFDHKKKTLGGLRLIGGPGRWKLCAPEPPAGTTKPPPDP